jgi:hypothetical protein
VNSASNLRQKTRVRETNNRETEFGKVGAPRALIADRIYSASMFNILVEHVGYIGAYRIYSASMSMSDVMYVCMDASMSDILVRV